MPDALLLETGTDFLLVEAGGDYLLESSGYASAVMGDSPIAYWRLGEASGTVAADSWGTNNGTYVATPTLAVGGASPTDANTAVKFDGSTQYVTVPDVNTLDLGDTFSLEAWVEWDGDTGTNSFIGKGSGNWDLRVNGSTGKIGFTKGITADIVASTTSITANAWHHVVYTKATTTSKIYINGIDRTGVVTDATMVNNAVNILIGAFRLIPAVDQAFHGSIDEVAVYNYALTVTQALAHFNAFPQRMPYSSPMPQILPL